MMAVTISLLAELAVQLSGLLVSVGVYTASTGAVDRVILRLLSQM